ncbi:glycerol-3-phosphate 1-O-acyltransferase PlsY [Litoribacillus peritrichatus]|uniref:Glycerol-3-phosphate acyltransferase n=1 Tax=Litoribacillus peritrichatus TaxID=718191 RepID=A0ABP7LY25_9GAMM
MIVAHSITLDTMMNNDLTLLLSAAFIAYLVGSLPTAMIISKFQHYSDPRQSGSGNAGATNMMRLHGWKSALITLIGDVLKGFLVVKLYQQVGNNSLTHLGVVASAVIIGHIYPLFFRFKGGKGVATILGTMIAISPILSAITLGLWLTALLITRISAYAALICALVSPIVVYFIDNHVLAFWCTCSAILLFSHRENIQQLLSPK